MRQLIVKNITSGTSSNGAPYLRITPEGGESITFFHSQDVGTKIEIGDSFECMVERKGQYLNGSGLKVIGSITDRPMLKPATPPVPVPPAPQLPSEPVGKILWREISEENEILPTLSLPQPTDIQNSLDANTAELKKLNAFLTRMFGGVPN